MCATLSVASALENASTALSNTCASTYIGSRASRSAMPFAFGTATSDRRFCIPSVRRRASLCRRYGVVPIQLACRMLDVGWRATWAIVDMEVLVTWRLVVSECRPLYDQRHTSRGKVGAPPETTTLFLPKVLERSKCQVAGHASLSLRLFFPLPIPGANFAKALCGRYQPPVVGDLSLVFALCAWWLCGVEGALRFEFLRSCTCNRAATM